MTTVLLAASLMINGVIDRPNRYHAIGMLQLNNGQSCVASVRIEDLPTRGFTNRWHYVIRSLDCNLKEFGQEWHQTWTFALPGAQQVIIDNWGMLTVYPIDPEMIAWCDQAATKVNDYPNGFVRQVTLKQTGPVWELLIEQPETV